jgi:crotonobetainyl-CoA:carnitine CoA-transferase CaiB-like acyl-CoA transferase
VGVYRLLSEYTVLDLSRTLPGPFCTWLLSGLGARVLVVEEPRPREAGHGESALGQARDKILYRDKRRLALNLKHDEGRRIFFRLLERADVVVEDFRPGVAARLGVDYTAVSRIRPEAVYCSISAFGQDGPYRGIPAHDINCLALAGLLDLTGQPGGPPTVPSTQVADLAAGSAAALAIVAALLNRAASGRGRYVDVAMLDATFAWMLIPLAARLAGSPPPRGSWVLGGSEPFYRVYRCKDGRHLSVGCLEPWLWKNLLDALGVADPTAERLEALFATRTRDEWCERLSGVNACVAPVKTLDEAMADPQLRHRAMFDDDPDSPRLGLPFTLPGTPAEESVVGAARGADTASILAELGLGDQIDRLRREGAV